MRIKLTQLTFLFILSLSWLVPAFAVTGLSDEVPEDLLNEASSSYIFVFEDKVQPGQIRGHAKQLTTQAGGQLRHVFTKALKGFSATVSATAAARIGDSPNIAFYEQNRIYSASDRKHRSADDDRGPVVSQGRGPGRDDDDDDDDDDNEEPSQVTPWGIERIGGPVDGTGLHAWIIDSGIDLDHPDLNVGFGANFVSLGSDDDPDDFDDAAGHGTHVAGTIAAIDNDIDVVGVAPNATVHSVRVLSSSGFGMTDWIVAGIDYVAANAVPGDCANMSLGGPGHQESIHNAIVNAAALGIHFSLAAGNESSDAEDFEPAHIDAENVYTISAIDSNDVFASFSNWGDPVDYAAPGVAIVSTRLGGGVTTMSGTSMAAPHVCGILLHQAPPNTDGFAINDP
ncbi:MAG: S8 family serine peptidase, partial [Gammaproteobacteria bacterium]|nr:S8 family serine peptidase [Gammaproteobacteria bacterium]